MNQEEIKTESHHSLLIEKEETQVKETEGEATLSTNSNSILMPSLISLRK